MKKHLNRSIAQYQIFIYCSLFKRRLIMKKHRAFLLVKVEPYVFRRYNEVIWCHVSWRSNVTKWTEPKEKTLQGWNKHLQTCWVWMSNVVEPRQWELVVMITGVIDFSSQLFIPLMKLAFFFLHVVFVVKSQLRTAYSYYTLCNLLCSRFHSQ